MKLKYTGSGDAVSVLAVSYPVGEEFDVDDNTGAHLTQYPGFEEVGSAQTETTATEEPSDAGAGTEAGSA
jgi:hypothetical protein